MISLYEDTTVCIKTSTFVHFSFERGM